MSVYGYSNAYASHGTDTTICKNDGYAVGQDNPFSQELCEQATDSG